MSDDRYPECAKLVSVAPTSNLIGEFIDWLHEHESLHLMRWAPQTDQRSCPVCYMWGPLRHDHEQCRNCDDTGYVQVEFDGWTEDSRTIEQLLAAYFDVDLAKVDDERRQMLDVLRAGQP